VRSPKLLLLTLLTAALAGGCGSSPPATPPQSASQPARPETPVPQAERPSLGLSNVEAGAGDSSESIPGSSDALYYYRFVQTFPGSDRFTFQDRDLSFYFRPAPDALHFQVENRQNRPVWIEWDRSVFYDPRSSNGKVAHATTTWADRFNTQSPTQITGLQRYSDYLLPLDYLLDPAGTGQQLHRPLLPEDTTAPQYSDREFGVDLVLRVEDRPRAYSFRFRVASVIKR
jgi:hypothetical protein